MANGNQQRQTQVPGQDMNPIQRLLANLNIGGLNDPSKLPDSRQELLSSLIQLGTSPEQFKENPARATGQAVRGGAGIAAQAAINPVKQAAQTVGPAMMDFGAGLFDISGEAQADPLKIAQKDPQGQAAIQAVKRHTSQQAQEALEAGVPPENVLSQAVTEALQRQLGGMPGSGPGFGRSSQEGANTGDLSVLQKAADQQAQLTRDLQAQQQQQGPALLQRLVSGFGEGFAQGVGLPSTLEKQQQQANIDFTRAQTVGSLLEPQLQQQEALRERTFEEFDDFKENVINPKISGEVSKQVGFLTAVQENVNALRELVNKDPSVLRRLANPGDSAARRAKLLINDIRAQLAPQRGGAALSPQELELVNQTLPQRGPVSGLFQTPEEVEFKLNRLDSIASGSLNRLDPLREERGVAQSLRREGNLTDEEVFSLFQNPQLRNAAIQLNERFSGKQIAEFFRKKGFING